MKADFEGLLNNAEEAIANGRRKVEYKGMELKVNEDDLISTKRALNTVIKQSIESLEKRFTRNQIGLMEHLTKFQIEKEPSEEYLVNHYNTELTLSNVESELNTFSNS